MKINLSHHNKRVRKGIPSLSLITLALLGLSTTASGMSVCNDMAFSNQTVIAGITHTYTHTTLHGNPMPGGAVAEDFNNDGWLDLFVVQANGGASLLYINDQLGGFVDEASTRGAALTIEGAGASAADYDNDGDIDIAVTASYGDSILLTNNGAGVFTSSIITGPFGVTMGSSWGDIDNDGLLELGIGEWAQEDQGFFLYQNTGGGNLVSYEFRNVPRNDEFVFAPRFADLNNDGLSDIHLGADFTNSQLYMNVGGGMFDNVTATNGTGGPTGGENDMGHAIGDYDNDGDLDIFTSDINLAGGNRLYRNNGEGVFTQVQDEAGVRDGDWAWGASFGDLDNDGDLDLYHVNGWFDEQHWIGTPSRLFMNEGDATFAEVANCAGADDRGQGRGMLMFDYDNDGDLDIFIVNNRDMEVVGDDFPGTPVLLRNDTSNGNNYLQVTLAGTPPMHRQGIGSRVYVQNGATQMMRELNASTNYLSQNPGRIAHFGMGTATTATEVRAEWVTGDATVLTNVAVNRAIAVPSPIATLSERTVFVNEQVTASANDEPNPVDWLIGGTVYTDPATVSFGAPGTRNLEMRVYNLAGTDVVRSEILRVEVISALPTLTPAPGSTLTGDTETFSWVPGETTLTFWRLLVGSTPGASDYFDSGVLDGTTTSVDVTGLPTDGSTIYVELRGQATGGGGALEVASYQYIAANGPALVTPAPGSTLSGNTEVFTWTDGGTEVNSWRLLVGSAPGASDYYLSAPVGGSTTSVTATNLPTDGSTIYVELRWQAVGSGGVVETASYEYTAADLQPEVVSPVPNATLTGDTETFVVTDGGTTMRLWALLVGSSAGASDYYFHLGFTTPGEADSVVISGLPTDGSTVYVSYAWIVDGGDGRIEFAHYQYTSASLP